MQLFHGDCLEIMKTLPDNSIDFILTDPPYGTTACKWDSIIPFNCMWKELKRLRKGTIALFGAEPFSSTLRISNVKEFKYDWIWLKSRATGHLNASHRPMTAHEIISIFNAKKYFPQTKTNYPRTAIQFKSEGKTVHPTQKPVALLEYLIRTYTLEGDTVLDFTMGSGSTGVACKNLNRKFIGIEKDDKYFEIAKQRLLGSSK